MSYFKTLWGKISDTVVRAVRIDAATHTMLRLNYVHHKIHEGNNYEYVEVVTLANAAVRDIQITTPNTAKWAHFFFDISVESETEWYLYEDVAINTPGTGYTPYNNNRNSLNTSGLTIAYIDNANVADANADTAVAGALTLQHGIVGAGKDGGSFEHDHEIELMQNEDYSLRFVANAAGYVSFHLSYYEHEDKN